MRGQFTGKLTGRVRCVTSLGFYNKCAFGFESPQEPSAFIAPHPNSVSRTTRNRGNFSKGYANAKNFIFIRENHYSS